MTGNVLICSDGSYLCKDVKTQFMLRGCTVVETNTYPDFINKAINGEYNYIVLEQIRNMSWATPIRKIVSKRHVNMCVIIYNMTRVSVAGAKNLEVTHLASVNDDPYKIVAEFMEKSKEILSRDKVFHDKESGIIYFREFMYDVNNLRMGYQGSWGDIRLRPAAGKIFERILLTPEKIVPYEDIFSYAYPKEESHVGDSSTLPPHISAIRKGLKEICPPNIAIRNDQSKGYTLTFMEDPHAI